MDLLFVILAFELYWSGGFASEYNGDILGAPRRSNYCGNHDGCGDELMYR
jgi:hypothetical protein